MSKIPVDFEGLVALSKVARRTGRQDEFIELALEWAAQATSAITPMRGALLWILWHHQGGSSDVGQACRRALGIGQFDRLTEQQVDEAKRWAPGLPGLAHQQQAQLAADLGERMVDAAMVEMANITPPLKRSECGRLIGAAMAAALSASKGA